ncbi:MAG: hypothetical protein ACYDDD_03250 [Acidithiobacillus ferrivorans]
MNRWVIDAGLDDGTFGVINDDPAWHTTKPIEGMAVTGEPGHRRLVPDDLGILVPGPAEGHDEEPGLADFSGHRINQRGTSTEVHLCGLSGCKDEAHGGIRQLYRCDTQQYATHCRVASGVSMIAHQGSVNGGALYACCCSSGDLFLMVFEGENTLGRGGLLAILLQKVARQMVLGWR